MKIDFNIYSFIDGVIISQAIFACILLWFSNQNKLSNRFLATLLLVIALWLVDDFCRVAGIYNTNANLYFMPIFYSFAFGPLLYFYVKSLINSSFRLQKKHFLHFIPVFLQSLLYLFLNFQPYTFKHWYWENVHQPYTYRFEFDGTLLSLLIYLLLSISLIKQYQIWLLDNFSETSKIRLNWLKILLVILVILCVQWFFEVILRDVYQIYFNYNYSIQLLGILALVLGTAGIKQINLENIAFIENNQENLTEKNASTKIINNNINDNTNNKNPQIIDDLILAKIVAGMEVEKLYLNPTLSLAEFAKSLQLPQKTVSNHINIGLKKSFNDFVNFYRVEEVKRRLKTVDIEKITILAIAFDAGFNSKTTFNRIFKHFTGVAPRDF